MSPDLISGLIPWWGHETMALLGCDAYVEEPGHWCTALEIYTVFLVLSHLYILAASFSNSWRHKLLLHINCKTTGPANPHWSSVSKMVLVQAWGPEFHPLGPMYIFRKVVYTCHSRTRAEVALGSHVHTRPYMCLYIHRHTMRLANAVMKLLKLGSTNSFLVLNWF